MSFKFTALALDHGPADALEKLVLMSLCDRADHNGVCFPSRADLSARCSVGQTCLTKKLRMLEAAGWIQRKKRFNASTVFRVNIQRLARLESEAQAARQTFVPHGFEPFEDETADLQPIENKGNDATRHGNDATRHTSDAYAASNLSTNQSLNSRGQLASALEGAEPAAPKCASPQPSTLTPFQRSALLSGQSFMLGKTLLKPSAPEFKRLAQRLRAKAEKKAVQA